MIFVLILTTQDKLNNTNNFYNLHTKDNTLINISK